MSGCCRESLGVGLRELRHCRVVAAAVLTFSFCWWACTHSNSDVNKANSVKAKAKAKASHSVSCIQGGPKNCTRLSFHKPYGATENAALSYFNFRVCITEVSPEQTGQPVYK